MVTICVKICNYEGRLKEKYACLSPDGDDDDDVAAADEEGGDDEQSDGDERHVEAPLPLRPKITS